MGICKALQALPVAAQEYLGLHVFSKCEVIFLEIVFNRRFDLEKTHQLSVPVSIVGNDLSCYITAKKGH